MAQTPQDPAGPNENRIRIALAAITGLFAGVTRAITDWILDHLGS